MNRAVALALAILLPACGADFAILNLKVVEGEGMVYAPGSRATRGLTVEVMDETGRPIPGVSVSFQLPEDGPSGEFLNGSRSDIVTTQADGRAAIWGMHWNKVPGAVTLRITAAKEGVRAGMVSRQYIDAAARAQSSKVSRGGHSRLLLVTLAVAGAAGAGVALGVARGSKTASATPTQTLSIGTPTVIVGAP